MPKVDVVNLENKSVGSVELDDSIFGVEVKEHLFHAAVRYQLAKRRAGTHQVKERADVRGGGRKPYRQKGTGRARQGTRNAPQFRGGGVVHGPRTRSHAHGMPKKVRKAALKSALSRRCEESHLTVFDAFELPEIKTKQVQKVLETFGFTDMLLILSDKNENVRRSARNIPGVTVLPVEGLNVYDVLKHQNVAMTQDAVAKIAERLGR
jgi:large subunit ribosomal protein L4